MKPLAPFSIEQAQAMILSAAPRMGAQAVAIDRALGRVCAHAVVAPGDQPRFDAAAMDGWAVAGDHGTYRVVGESRAGRCFGAALRDGEAVAISTGAVMPVGASALIRREKAREEGGRLHIAAYAPGRDIRPRGCDFAAGAVLVPVGRRIDHLDIARVAAAGLDRIMLARCPHVAVLATGDEIVPAGAAATEASNFDALSPAVLARLGGAGVGATHLGIAGDDDAAIQHKLAQAQGEALIVIGGASGGRHDRVRHALAARGLRVIVPGVAMRPGKPFWCAVMDDGRMVFGLPGNPVAALVAMELLVIPALMAMMGAHVAQRWIDVPDHRSGETGDMARIRFARWGLGEDGALRVVALGQGDSAALAPLAGANGLIRTGEGRDDARLLPLALTSTGGPVAPSWQTAC